MKISQFKKIIQEEVRTVLKEQEASDAMAAIEHIKAAVKDLSGSTIAQEDAVLQHLMAKYTGLLGKITSYIKTKYHIEDEPAEEDTEGQEDTPEERKAMTSQERPQAPVKPQPQGPKTSTSGAPDYSKTV